MMWLSQNQKSSYKTINRFRVSPKVDALLESLFIQFHSQCLKQNLINNQAIFIDGTKVEANAMINVFLNETLNYMNVMIVQNVLWNSNVWTSNQKQIKKIMKNYNWEYFKAQINKKTFRTKNKNHLQSKKNWCGACFGFHSNVGSRDK